jgi:hypothetical protein
MLSSCISQPVPCRAVDQRVETTWTRIKGGGGGGGGAVWCGVAGHATQGDRIHLDKLTCEWERVTLTTHHFSVAAWIDRGWMDGA